MLECNHWEIFQQNMHYQGRSGGNLEPRQILIAELNGDDLLDFAFLVHDRVLIILRNDSFESVCV